MTGIFYEDLSKINLNLIKAKNLKLLENVDHKNKNDFLNKNKIENFIVIKKDEEITHWEDIDHNKNTNILILGPEWADKEDRIISKKINKSNEHAQNIKLTSKKITHPILSADLKNIKDLYIEKKYNEFCLEAEKLIFENKIDRKDYLMLSYYMSIIFYFKNKNIEKSRKLLRNAIKIKPDFHEAWCAWADILLDAGKLEEAKLAYQECMLAFKKRSEFDFLPYCQKRGTEYPEKMIEKITSIKREIKFIKKLDQDY